MNKTTQGKRKNNIHNQLTDLNDFLFGEMERLDNPDLTDDELKTEILRSKSMTEISGQIISIHQTQIRKVEVMCEYGMADRVDKTLMIEG